MAEGLDKRANELKTLVEDKHENALKNILESQENQKKSQNNQHRITEETLPIGTKVYVKVTGMHDKLHPTI